MSSIPVLKWSPVVGNINSSTVLLDSLLGQSWNIRLAGTGPNNQTIYPRVVIVDNMGNNAIVSFTYGLSRYQIPPYVRRTIHILPGQEYILFNVTTGVLTLTFCDFDPELPEEENTVATNQSGTGGGTGAVYSTWNPADKSGTISVSGANLTINTNTTDYNSIRGLYPKTTGKFYIETTMAALDCWLGIANVSLGLVSQPPNTANCIVYLSNGQILGNGGVLSTITNWSVGDVIRLAVDLSAAKFWTSKVGLDWNGSPSADPSTGTGSFSFAYITGQIYPLGGLYFPGTMTTNFGASPFSGIVPTGFTSGWTQ